MIGLRSKRALASLTIEVAFLLPASSCQWIGHYDDFSAATDAQSQSTCAGLATRDKAGLHGSNLLLIDDPQGGCFWMDAHEATVGDYEGWLAAVGGNAPEWDGDRCGWKTPEAGAPIPPFDPARSTQAECAVPSNQTDPFDPLKPIRCVDWCEAEAFCRWAGKRLCYNANDFRILTPTGQRDEWGIACTAGGKQPYPFDVSLPGTACNFEQSASCLQQTGQNGCGPYEGTIQGLVNCRPLDGYPNNLAGNVAEWVDLCESDGQATATCRYVGGAYNSSMAAVACTTIHVFAPRNTRDETIGVRCCSGLTTDELRQIGR